MFKVRNVEVRTAAGQLSHMFTTCALLQFGGLGFGV